MRSRWTAIRKRRKARRRRKTRFGITTVVRESGPPCRRCKQATEVREHGAITEKHLAQPFYYTRWFRCTNRKCKTTLIMPEEFKVWNYDRRKQ
jgi:hypothetical protein